jgi:D-alanyl-D-alanine carboxypeptidase
VGSLRSAVLFSAFVSLCPAALPDVEQSIDQLFRPVGGGKSPGAVVAVIRDGKVMLMKSYGMASVDKGTPNSAETIFRLASITKSFTATAVLQLVERGKLKLEDPLSTYLPEFPNSEKIRISHLLSHTAGVPDFIPYEELTKQPLEFPPGSRINYSNNGYMLLGHVIEKVSGQRWDEYLRDHIFAPLAMKHSGYDRTAELAGRATGYLATSDGSYQPIGAGDARGAYAAGGLYSTVEDLVRWEQALTSGKLVRKETLETAWTPRVLSDGRIAPYGFGWITSSYRGLREVGHGGDITGFNTYFARYPEEKFTVIVLSNTGMRPAGPLPAAGDLAHRIAEICLADRMEKAKAPAVIRVDAKILDTYVGRYKVDASEAVIQHMGSHIVITRVGDSLVAEANGVKLQLQTKSEAVFQGVGSPAELTFVRGTAEKSPGIIVSLMGLREFQALRVEE